MTSLITRRTFLHSTATMTSGLLVPFYLDLTRFDNFFKVVKSTKNPQTSESILNGWLRIGTDDIITILMPHSEMGQGVHTALAMLVAEELDADWEKIRVEMAPVGPEIYEHTGLGQYTTAGSFSVTGQWENLRLAGASARALLIKAAAQHWQVSPQQCRTNQNKVRLTTQAGDSLSYGELANTAAQLKLEAPPTLKTVTEFKLLGTAVKRLDIAAKVDGSAIFGLDVRVPGMKYAAIKQAPVFESRLQSYTPKTLPGVRLVELPDALAVVANSYWEAKQSLEQLTIKFTATEFDQADSSSIQQRLRQGLSASIAAKASSVGNFKRGMKAAKTMLKAEYSVPFLAHVTMEPQNCTAIVKSDACEIWAPTQAQGKIQTTLAELLKLPTEKIKIHTTYLGGGFGRRLEIDVVIQAVLIAKAVGAPVQLIWSREEDIQHDFYRPAMMAQLIAGLDETGLPQVFRARVTGPSILSRVSPTWLTKNFDYLAVEGINQLAYQIPNQYIDYVMTNTPVPVGFWRSLGHSYNAFFVESFIDEIAHHSQRDPYQLRRELLSEQPEFLEVLDTLADKSNWKPPVNNVNNVNNAPAGPYRGMAIHRVYGSIVGQVAEVTISHTGEVTVTRIISVVHCGFAVHPDTIHAQIEGGIIYGLAALTQAITLKRGRVEQSNFHDYPILRMAAVPIIEIHLLPSSKYPTGVGEIATPPTAPAVTNAIFAATGQRIRELPITDPKQI